MSTDVHSLIGAYVLDALDDLERVAFERHLRDCETCRVEADELFEVTARLADGVWAVPPPRLRDNVLAEITNTRQLAPAVAARPQPQAQAQPPAQPPSQAQPQARPQVRSRRGLRLVAAAAAVAAAIGGGAAYQVQAERVQDARATAEEARASEARIRAIMAAPDLMLRDAPVTQGGRVTVASSNLLQAGVIMLAAEKTPALGRVLQMWTIRDGTASSVTVLEPGQSAAVQVVEGLPGADVGVTAEPPGGSATPTEPLWALVRSA